MAKRTCSIEDCDRTHQARGLCERHYRRLRITGTTSLRRTAESRFWEKVDRTGDCWLWIATLNNKGYGQFWDGTLLVLAHRWSYEHHREPIPDGMVIDHRCRTPACVNPEHMEVVTQAENMARARLEVCRRGHPYAENEYIAPDGRRYCRRCAQVRRQRQKESL